MTLQRKRRPGPIARLERLRKRIDAIDLRILQLLDQRAVCVLRVGQLKRRKHQPVVDSQREQDVLRQVTRATTGPLSRRAIRSIFAEILRHSRRLQGR